MCGNIFLVDGGWTPLYESSPSWFLFFFFLFSFFFSLSFFWHALWACGIPSLSMHLLFLTCQSMCHTFFGYASFIYFCIATYLLSKFSREMSYGDMEFLLGGCRSGYVANFQCRSVACGSVRVRDLDHGSMKWISLRVTTIWQNSMRKQIAYLERLFKLVIHMALDGNFISLRNFIIFVFSKLNTLDVKYHIREDHSNCT